MKKSLLISILLITVIGLSQEIIRFKDVKPDKEYDNIYVKKVSDDELQTSFLIWVKDSVRLHKHEHHSENIYVLEGKGEMRISDEIFVIKKGDYFNIPKNTPHALKVLSSAPVKVLSIQSPKFEGKDRVFIEE